MKLWLDDVRDPIRHGYAGFVWVKTAREAIEQLQTGEVTFASLDHDLSAQATMGNWRGQLTGYEVVCWMERNDVWPRDGVAVHSMNPAGRKRMEAVIQRQYGRLFTTKL
jgi:hypothetical protein